jgi:hypothetical protein
MAFVAARNNGSWEIRESHVTSVGPRSRTLATFTTLTPEVLERARARARGQFDPEGLRQAARRAGAPVAPPDSDRASAELIAELQAGRRPRPMLARILLGALQTGVGTPSSDNARAAAAWIGATPQQRGHALRELLLLADSLPRRHRSKRARFPRIESEPA